MYCIPTFEIFVLKLSKKKKIRVTSEVFGMEIFSSGASPFGGTVFRRSKNLISEIK
jgi:hypothetical protein